MSKSNLFIGEESSPVNSPVISLALNSCGSKRRRRRRSASTPTASTGVDINLSEPSSGISVNDTPSADNDGIMLSMFNLTSPGKMPILLRVVPLDPGQVNVFVRRNETPSASEYEWYLTSSNGTNNYTLYIPAELTIGVDQLFVGVQSFTGRPICLDNFTVFTATSTTPFVFSSMTCRFSLVLCVSFYMQVKFYHCITFTFTMDCQWNDIFFSLYSLASDFTCSTYLQLHSLLRTRLHDY